MPEREIPEEKIEEIKTWVFSVKRGDFDLDNMVWIVDGEPIVIHRNWKTGESKFFLSCSERNAQELEEAGIVSFQEVQETAK